MASAKLSAELFTVPLPDGSFIVYAPLRRAAFVANAALVNVLASAQEKGWLENADDASVGEFLRQLEILDGKPECAPSLHLQGEPEPTAVTLFLTTACNLRCTYCYASAGDTPTKFMPLEVAKGGIDFVSENARRKGIDHFDVTYHGGGEPTVHWRVMVDSLEYAHRRGGAMGLNVNASCATNGVLSDAQVDWIISSLSGVSLSFDGLPTVHDKNRLTVLGRGSSDRVMATMRSFDKAAFPYGLRVTVTADHIARLPESISFICSNFAPTKIQVEPAYQLGRWENAPSAETEAFIQAFRASQAVANGHGREIHFSTARVGSLTNHFCGVSRDGFSLSPDGNVSACYEVFSEDSSRAEAFFYGKPTPSPGKYLFDFKILNNLRGQGVQQREFCAGCFAKWSCGGDCYHKALTVSIDGTFSGSDRCHITRELTKDQILDKITRSGGLVWHEESGNRSSEASGSGKEFLL